MSHIKGVSMKTYMLHKLNRFKHNIEFINSVSLEELPRYYNDSIMCVYPSIWDNFPLVCMDAMCAGKAIVAGNKGGMKDMLENDNAGLLVNPLKPFEIAKSIIYLLENEAFRKEIGLNARKVLLEKYSNINLIIRLEQHYKQTIASSIR